MPTDRAGVRVDSGVESGGVVSPHYDPMLAKVIAHAPTRAEAAAALAATLAGARIHGVTTNRDLLVRTLRHPAFAAGDTDTGFLDRHGLDVLAAPLADEGAVGRHAVAAALAGQAAPPGRRPGCWPPCPRGGATTSVDRQEVTFDVGRRALRVAYRMARRGRRGGRGGARRRGRSTCPSAPSAPTAVTLTAGGVTRRYAVQRVGAVTYVDGPDGSSRLVEEDRHPVAAEQGRRGLGPRPHAGQRGPGGRGRRRPGRGRAGARGPRGHEDGARRARRRAGHGGRGGRGRGRPGRDGPAPGGGRGPMPTADRGRDGGGAVSDPLRIANCSGFYGDRLSAAREMVEGGPIDVLTGDWLAELTMLILWKGLPARRARGAGPTPSSPRWRRCSAPASTGASRWSPTPAGLNPAGLADQVRLLADRLGLSVAVAHVEGDDLLPAHRRAARPPATRSPTSTPGEPLAVGRGHGGVGQRLPRAPGRSSRPSGPAPTWWSAPGSPTPRWWSARRPGTTAGPRPTGTRWPARWSPATSSSAAPRPPAGNYAFFTEVPGLEHPGFPIAEVAADGSSVITKHPGTGGEVSVGTVTAQLLYEIGGHHYPNTDVVARFDTIEVADEGGRPGAAVGHPGPARTARRQGLPQPARRLAQHHDLRAHRARHRGQGRPDRAVAGRRPGRAPASSPSSTPG